MAKCSKCQKNEAVIFTTRYENGQHFNDGLCLKCAYDTKLVGMDDMFEKAGINPENVEEITKKMNVLMKQMNEQSPQELLASLFGSASGMMDENVSVGDLLSEAINQMGIEDSTDEPDEADEEPLTLDTSKDKNEFGLMPATMGNEINAISDESKDKNSSSKPSSEPKKKSTQNTQNQKKKFLNQFGTNLTEKAENGEIDRIIGRKNELERVIQILNRRSKNNPVLLGEPGVGKTAIAEGLAVKIVNKEVPDKLLEQQIYQLDMTAMVAGTQFRGQFESRMKGVVDEAKKAGNVILVIDELHNIMGAGDAEGAMNAANILKPALAKGEIRLIGATTLEEYRRNIEKDSALERRFQKVIVEEPSPKETIEIIKGIKDYYESHHHVTYTNDIINYTVRLADRYIMDRFMPDKAIDLLDEAGSKANLKNTLLVELQIKENNLDELKQRKEEIMQGIAQAKNDQERNTFYAEESELRAQELRLETELIKLEKKKKPTKITKNDVAKVVEMWTGIPVQQITESESELLLNLEDRLHKRVIGQDKAVNAIARAFRRNRAGFGKKHKPSSFIFVGPTGVGKTELVKAVAETMFNSETALLRLDMSEFMESHTVSKLIGSPPGYVGYDDGGQLTEKVRRKPYSVILLDEIEKAHKDVFNILLQIFDDGRLTDSHGRVVNFENTVIVMTSNAGTNRKTSRIGFGADTHEALENKVNTSLQQIFAPEFLNRIDEIIIFNELSREELRKIVDLMLKEVKEEMKNQGYKFIITDATKDYLAEKGYDPKYGARPLRKSIQRLLEDKLAEHALAGDFAKATSVSADLKEDNGEKQIVIDWI